MISGGHVNQTHPAPHAVSGLISPDADASSPARADADACWQEAISRFLQNVEPELESLEERLEQIKEQTAACLQPLVEHYARIGDGRLVMELNTDGTLRLVRPDAEAAKAASGQEFPAAPEASPEAETLMRSLAVESALVRCVDDLRAINSLLRANRSARSRKPADPQAELPPYPAYQVCLKGPLSHFYFSRS